MKGRLLAAAAAALAGAARGRRAAGPAADGPGSLSHFDLARKDCVGTARNTTLEGLVHGRGRRAERRLLPDQRQHQRRDAPVRRHRRRDVHRPPDPRHDLHGAARSTDRGADVPGHRDREERHATGSSPTTSPTPAARRVLMRSRFEALRAADPRLQALRPLRPDAQRQRGRRRAETAAPTAATIATAGGHTVLVGSDPVTATNAANRDYAEPVYSALDALAPFAQVSNGFAGPASDGLKQLDASHALTPTFATAEHGNLVQTARGRPRAARRFTLALGFGATQAASGRRRARSLGRRFGALERDYARGWHRYDAGAGRAAAPCAASPAPLARPGRPVLPQRELVKAAEDKTFPGARRGRARLAVGPGRSPPATRPTHTSAPTARCSRATSTRRGRRCSSPATAHGARHDEFLFDRQQLPDGSMPRNSLPERQDRAGHVQHPARRVLLPDWSWRSPSASPDARSTSTHIKPAANFVDQPRAGLRPRALGGAERLFAVDDRGRDRRPDRRGADRRHNRDRASARASGAASPTSSSATSKRWTVTTNGPLSSDPYFIRLSKTGDPNAAVTYDSATAAPTLDQRTVIDAGFLELARLGCCRPTTPTSSLADRSSTRRSGRTTATGDGFTATTTTATGTAHATATRGRRPTRATATCGRCSPGSEASTRSTRGDSRRRVAARCGDARWRSGVGLIPEQVWELPDLPASPFGTDPTLASIGFKNGQPAGSAAALTWSAGQFVRLMLDVVGRPACSIARPTRPTATSAITRAQTPLTVTAPPTRRGARHARSGAPARRRRATRSRSRHEHRHATRHDDRHEHRRDADGELQRRRCRSPAGRPCSTSSPRAPSGATARASRTVAFDDAPGTAAVESTIPTATTTGRATTPIRPATTSMPGAFDLERFQVFDDGTNAIFRVRLRDLTRRSAARSARSSSTSTSTSPALRRRRWPRRSHSATTRSPRTARGAA